MQGLIEQEKSFFNCRIAANGTGIGKNLSKNRKNPV